MWSTSPPPASRSSWPSPVRCLWRWLVGCCCRSRHRPATGSVAFGCVYSFVPSRVSHPLPPQTTNMAPPPVCATAQTAFCSYKALRTEPQYRHRILGRMSKVRSFEDLASLARQSDREGGRNRLAAPPLPAAVAGRRGRRTAVEADRSQVRVGRRWILTPSAPRGHARRRETGGASFPRTLPNAAAATATDPLIPGQGADRRRRRRRGRRRHRAYRRKGPNPQGAPAFANASVATKTRRLVRRNSFVV